MGASANTAHAQEHPTEIGGPETTTPYADAYARMDSLTDERPWSSEDSAHYIPGYELYGDFDTDAIFERVERAKRDSATLHLAIEPCDHHFPIIGAINSPFGPRGGRMHYGIDIELDEGDPVTSAFEGMVRISRFHPQFGNVIVIRHANGLETLYGHLSELHVAVGDHVEAGDLIGLGGTTGRSTGSHLHFETRYLGQPIDPQLLFNPTTGELRTNSLLVHPGLFTTVTKHAAVAHRTYRVRRGDTLSSIARRHRTSVKALCSANRLSKRSKLRVGQRLRIK
jgi:murein DD-endopeptidase MepM/ murein hydrolase activator NlpD